MPESPGAAAFYIDGKDFPGISNVTCDGCDLRHMVMGALFTAPAPGSGVRNSRIHQGTTTSAYYEIVGSGAVNENNTLDPLVYYAVCSTCGEAAQRAVARGPDATYALRASDGHQVWSFPAGKYANPVISDGDRLYVTGRAHEYAFARKGSKVVKAYLLAQRAKKKHAQSQSGGHRKKKKENR